MTKKTKITNHLTRKKILLTGCGIILFCTLVSMCRTPEYMCGVDVICRNPTKRSIETKETLEARRNEINVRFIKNNKPVSGIVKGQNAGQLVIQHVKNGKLNGNIKMFWENGRLRFDLNMKDNLEHGKYKEFYENGSLKEEINYENGRVRDKKIYYENGQLQADLHYTDSVLKPGLFVLTGKNRTYHENGQLASEVFYKDEKVVEKKMYDEQGKETSECEQELAELEEFRNNAKMSNCIKRVMEDSYVTSSYGEIQKACAQAEAEAAVIYYNKKRIIQKKCNN